MVFFQHEMDEKGLLLYIKQTCCQISIKNFWLRAPVCYVSVSGHCLKHAYNDNILPSQNLFRIATIFNSVHTMLFYSKFRLAQCVVSGHKKGIMQTFRKCFRLSIIILINLAVH